MRDKNYTGTHAAVKTGRDVTVKRPAYKASEALRRRKPDRAAKHKFYLCLAAAAVILLFVTAVLLLKTMDTKEYNRYMAEAVVHYEAHEYESALIDLRRAAEIERGDECLMLAVECYEALGNLDRALVLLREMDTLDPAVSRRIAALEQKREQLLAEGLVTVAGAQYSAATTAIYLDGRELGDKVLEELQQLYALNSLSLANNGIEDISALSALGGLSTLDLSGNKVSDLSPLSSLSGLRVLNLDGNPIEDLKPLYSLSNLSSLSIKGISLDQQQLEELSKALPNCAIHSEATQENALDISIGGVTFKSDVRELDLSGMGIIDISALGGCSELKKLNLSGNDISEISALMNIPGLEYLNISGNQISDLRPLMSMSTLKYVYASANQVSSTVALSGLSNLMELDLSENPISDFSGLRKIKSLQSLNLKATGLNDEALNSFTSLTSLIRLNVEENDNISGEAVNALWAALGNCTISHSPLVFSVAIGNGSFRTDSTELDLSGMGISDLAPLMSFGKIETLNLAKNSLINIYILENTESRKTIRELNLSGNQLEDISPLAALNSLESLDLSNNRIYSVVPLLGLNNLRNLDLSGNLISAEQLKTLRDTLVNCNIICN